jgi:hypothetical protein
MKLLTKVSITLVASLLGVSNVGHADDIPCSEGGVCQVGDVGPGGGIVFYVDSKLNSWGRYIEVAPNGWNRGRPDPSVRPYCYEKTETLDYLPITSPTIGDGKSNTDRLIKVCPNGAAATARAYQGGGQKNWSLPSKEEFEEFYYEAPGLLLNEGNPWYWTSTNDEYGRNYAFYEPREKFDGSFSRTNDAHVRPVRHFMSNSDKQFLADQKIASEKKYKNCSALNSVFPGGIASKSNSKNKGGKTYVAPYVSTKGYSLNKGLDRDKDGIVCER